MVGVHESLRKIFAKLERRKTKSGGELVAAFC
jgi:hypothetical protein